MQFTLPALFFLAGTTAADWLVQEYSGLRCTGQRVGEITPLGGPEGPECRQLQPNLASSVLLSLNSDDLPYRFRLHNDNACNDQEFSAGANLIPGNDNVCFFTEGAQYLEIVARPNSRARGIAQPFEG